MRDRIAKKRQRRVDEMRDGVFLAVISESDEVSAVGEQCSGGIGGVGHWTALASGCFADSFRMALDIRGTDYK